MKKLIYTVLFLVVFVLGVTFAARNPERVVIDYYFGIHLELPLTVLLLGSLVVGVLIGYLASLAGGYRRQLRRAARQRSSRPVSNGTSIATREG